MKTWVGVGDTFKMGNVKCVVVDTQDDTKERLKRSLSYVKIVGGHVKGPFKIKYTELAKLQLDR